MFNLSSWEGRGRGRGATNLETRYNHFVLVREGLSDEERALDPTVERGATTTTAVDNLHYTGCGEEGAEPCVHLLLRHNKELSGKTHHFLYFFFV